MKPADLGETMSEHRLASALSELSRGTIARLEEATELSDAAMIDQVIEDIRCDNVQLAEGLSPLAQNFSYDIILALVQIAKERISGTQDQH